MAATFGGRGKGQICQSPELSRHGPGAGWRQACALCSSSSPSLFSWEQPSLTKGGSGGGALLWVLTFTGLHRALLFSFTCFLLLTTPILSENTQQTGDVSRPSEPQYRRVPPAPSGWPIREKRRRDGSGRTMKVKIRTWNQFRGSGRLSLHCLFPPRAGKSGPERRNEWV